jgi:hypothetical protein
MNIPTFPNVQFTKEDGYLTSPMQLYNDQLNQALQNGLSDNGWTVPIVTSAELADIAALPSDRAMPDGTMWYVSDAVPPIPVMKVGGVLMQFTMTPYP